MWNCSNYKSSDTYYSLQSCIHGLSSSARHVDLNSSHARWQKANFASVGNNNTWRRHSGREEAHSYSRRMLSVTSIQRRCGRCCCKNPSPSLLETTSWELLTGDDDDSRRLPSGFPRMTTASSTIWPCCCCCQQTSSLLFVLLGVLFPQGRNNNKGQTSVRTTAPQKHKGEDPGTKGQCRASNPRFHAWPLRSVQSFKP